MAIGKSIARLAQEKNRPAVDDRPGCAFGMVTRRGLDDLARDLDRLEAKINAVVAGVLAMVIMEIWRSLR